MAEIDQSRYYLDYTGLAEYDRLLKQLIDNNKTEINADLDELLESLAGLANTVDVNKTNTDAAIQANTDAIAILNGDKQTNGSVAKQVSDAVNGILNGAPEAFDTLKEIADWISSDETGTAALLSRVSGIEDDIEEEIAARKDADNALKAYIDSRDDKVYNSTNGISLININSLFNAKIAVAEGQSVADAIQGLSAGRELVLNNNSTVSENLTISNDAVIDANGSTFTGTVTIAKDADVIIKNATFANPVVIQ